MVKRISEENNFKYIIRDSRLFKQDSFRTSSIGDNEKHKLIRGRLKKNNKYKTQSVTVEKKLDKELRKETSIIIRKALSE